jgi:hypothetical protein
MRLFARGKYGSAMPIAMPKLQLLWRAILTGDPLRVRRTKVGNPEYVDFTGQVVKIEEILKRAEALEREIDAAVGPHNTHFDPPPTAKLPGKLPKVPEWIKIFMPDRLVKLIEEWLEDDSSKGVQTRTS